ncbi:MAG: nucleotidyltransferase domain-containing protein [Chitinophagaceae bacterium]|nr:nucleotidyltransferase domain-containing protein [Chitinophagaceae bacterium]
MIQKEFAQRVTGLVSRDPSIIGLAVAGSWADDDMDEYSDLDLVLVSREKIGGNREKMIRIAKEFGDFISGFTGEHVSEPRLLVCLYDNPLLHVDIKFVTLQEFQTRVDDPVVIFEREGQLSEVIRLYPSQWPAPDLQWIEDRFWTWVHYIATKIGRGEYFEALSNLDYLRMNVLSPLMQLKNSQKARGLRKVEKRLTPSDLENLKITVAQYNKASLVKALDNSISVYKSLRRKIGTESLEKQTETEKKVWSTSNH